MIPTTQRTAPMVFLGVFCPVCRLHGIREPGTMIGPSRWHVDYRPRPAGHHPRVPAGRRNHRAVRPAGQVRGDDMTQATARSRQPVQQARRPGGARAAARQARVRRVARWVFLLPAVAYVLFAFAIPVVYNLVLSLEQTSPATISHLAAPFAGLSNYTTTLRNPVAHSAIVRTFSFTVLSLLFQFVIGFALALLFNLQFPLRRLARSLILVPWLLPLLVTGVIFKFLFQLQAGAVNQVLLDLHVIHQPVGFEVSPGWAYLTVLITNIWIGVPFFTVLLYSALQDVPAELDGGGPDRRGGGLAAADPGHAADHQAGDRGGIRPGLRVHDQGVRRGDRADQRRPGQLHPADRHLGVQPVVPGVRLRRRARR